MGRRPAQAPRADLSPMLREDQGRVARDGTRTIYTQVWGGVARKDHDFYTGQIQPGGAEAMSTEVKSARDLRRAEVGPERPTD